MKTVEFLKSFIQALFHLLYPPLCVVCKRGLTDGEKFLCSFCRVDFPLADGDYNVGEAVLACFPEEHRPLSFYFLFYYSRHSAYKQLIYAVKYRSRKDLGTYLGRMLGERIQGKVQADGIIPIPLHPKREKKRGFNQSRQIALGMSEVLGIPVWDDVVKRVRNNVSQTGLSADARQKNTENLFLLEKPEKIRGKHLLIVDDVITTGATIRSCMEALNAAGKVRYSLACLARTLS